MGANRWAQESSGAEADEGVLQGIAVGGESPIAESSVKVADVSPVSRISLDLFDAEVGVTSELQEGSHLTNPEVSSVAPEGSIETGCEEDAAPSR